MGQGEGEGQMSSRLFMTRFFMTNKENPPTRKQIRFPEKSKRQKCQKKIMSKLMPKETTFCRLSVDFTFLVHSSITRRFDMRTTTCRH
jgi:hypothetical protein